VVGWVGGGGGGVFWDRWGGGTREVPSSIARAKREECSSRTKKAVIDANLKKDKRHDP